MSFNRVGLRINSIPDEGTTSSDDELLYVKYIREFNRRNAWTIFKYEKHWREFNRLLSLILGAYICNVDLCARHDERDNEDDSHNTRSPPRSRADWPPKLVEKSAWRRRLKCGWLSWAIYGAHLVLMAYLCIVISHMYGHEINRMRVKRARDLIAVYGPERLVAVDWGGAEIEGGSSTGSSLGSRRISLGRFERILQARVREQRLALAFWGDKFIDWGILNVCAFVTSFSLSAAIFTIIAWLYLWAQKHDHQFLRDQIEPEAEARLVDARCESLVREYLESHRVHTSIVAGQDPGQQASRSSCEANNFILAGRELRAIGTSINDDAACQQLLVRMLNRGALRPHNRSYLQLKYRDLAHALVYLSSIFYCVAFLTLTFGALYARSTPGFDASELGIIINELVISCALVYHQTTIVISCFEQVLYVRHVLGVIRECVRLNEREFCLMRAQSASDKDRHGVRCRAARHSIGRMNSNYLFALMTYKMFVAQFAPYKRTNRGTFLLCFSISFIIPVTARIHVPYLENKNSNFGLLVFIISMSTLIPIDMVCVPMCYLHARCQKLYVGLSSLMAHIARVRQHENEQRAVGAKIYNDHAVIVLQKELSDPAQMLKQFRVRSPGIDCTYADLVKLHFWLGLVVLSFLLAINGDYQDLFSSSASASSSWSKDPLGVWCFRLV